MAFTPLPMEYITPGVMMVIQYVKTTGLFDKLSERARKAVLPLLAVVLGVGAGLGLGDGSLIEALQGAGYAVGSIGLHSGVMSIVKSIKGVPPVTTGETA